MLTVLRSTHVVSSVSFLSIDFYAFTAAQAQGVDRHFPSFTFPFIHSFSLRCIRTQVASAYLLSGRVAFS